MGCSWITESLMLEGTRKDDSTPCSLQDYQKLNHMKMSSMASWTLAGLEPWALPWGTCSRDQAPLSKEPFPSVQSPLPHVLLWSPERDQHLPSTDLQGGCSLPGDPPQPSPTQADQDKWPQLLLSSLALNNFCTDVWRQSPRLNTHLFAVPEPATAQGWASQNLLSATALFLQRSERN